jgi:DNA-binding CsgD family transcriptional regulator
MQTAFVGRLRELRELEQVLDAAAAGRGATVLISGEAGIGKTRLASEGVSRARAAGFEVRLGHSIDLVGSELPFQPFAHALRPEWTVHGSRLQVFEHTLEILGAVASAAPLLVVLEDVHWADVSTLDLIGFLAHNLDDRRVALLVTYRPDEVPSAARLRRLADGVRRSDTGRLLELGPLTRAELTALLGASATAVTETIISRSEGNPFFAQELLAAAGAGELPPRLRDVLTARIADLDKTAQSLLRVAAAAGRDVSYPLLSAVTALPDRDVHESLRAAVEHGALVVDGSRLRFRHALLAEAVYATILPGEREWLHARLADELSSSSAAGPGELAPHWALAGRNRDALAASIAAADEAEAMSGLAEALGHLDRALGLWATVPDAARLAGCDEAQVCARAAELASQVGAASRAVQLVRRAIDRIGTQDPAQASRLHTRLGEYLYESGEPSALAELERAVALAPAGSAEHAYALGSLAGGMMMSRRHRESLRIAEQALAAGGGDDARVRALTVVGLDLAYLGRAEEGLEHLHRALQLAADVDDRWGLDRAYVNCTDVLTMLGRPRESAQLAATGLEALRRYGIHSPLLICNQVEALLMIGEWGEADRVSAAAVRGLTDSFSHATLTLRADVEIGRGDFAAARAHLQDASVDQEPGLVCYWLSVTELALWERRWEEAGESVRRGLDCTGARATPQIAACLCARAEAELAALARGRRDAEEVRAALARADDLLSLAPNAAPLTPEAGVWCTVAQAEHARAHGRAPASLWADAASRWEALERPPLTAYCRWRQAEALVAAGASRLGATAPLRDAHVIADRLQARPLQRELELLADRARLDPTPPEDPAPPTHLEAELGLTPREAEVLALVARGLTNREIAAQLVISTKTASVHVSHILRKLDAPNRREAAALAHRVEPPPRR